MAIVTVSTTEAPIVTRDALGSPSFIIRVVDSGVVKYFLTLATVEYLVVDPDTTDDWAVVNTGFGNMVNLFARVQADDGLVEAVIVPESLKSAAVPMVQGEPPVTQ